MGKLLEHIQKRNQKMVVTDHKDSLICTVMSQRESLSISDRDKRTSKKKGFFFLAIENKFILPFPDTLTSVCIFSTMFYIQGEFV